MTAPLDDANITAQQEPSTPLDKTTNLGLEIATETIRTENVRIDETIIAYGENFKILDNLLGEKASNADDLVQGKEYKVGDRIWNGNPVQGGYVGWVNIRQGIYAKERVAKKKYQVGELIRATPANDNVYECVVTGRAAVKNPVFLTAMGAEFEDAQGTVWEPDKIYQVNDVVFSTDGKKVYYYICETSGKSDSLIEPDWDTYQESTALNDGSVVWRKEKMIIWKQKAKSANFRPFGKID